MAAQAIREGTGRKRTTAAVSKAEPLQGIARAGRPRTWVVVGVVVRSGEIRAHAPCNRDSQASLASHFQRVDKPVTSVTG